MWWGLLMGVAITLACCWIGLMCWGHKVWGRT